MTDLRKAAEALRLADWLDDHRSSRGTTLGEAAAELRRLHGENKALRQALTESANSTTDFVESKALTQPEQEPVGYVTDSGTSAYFSLGVDLEDETPLYTAPPKREWVGLTDQEIEDLWNQHESRFDYYSFSCDIEAKLKEKNT